jgi:hypothetical protein
MEKPYGIIASPFLPNIFHIYANQELKSLARLENPDFSSRACFIFIIQKNVIRL